MKVVSKKGFTLVELLAVIIILSLLALIAGTSITKILKDSKEDLYKNQMVLIKSAAETWGSENISLLPDAGECKYITLGDLKGYGLLDSKVVDPRTNEEFSDELNIKVTGNLSKTGKLVLDYEVGAENVEGCGYPYPPKLDPQGTYMMLSSDVSSADTTFLGGTIKRNQIELIKVTYTKEVPSDAIGSWDVSQAQDKSVMAWYTDKDNNDLYELYIGGDGGVKAIYIRSLFAYFNSVKTIDVSYLDTSGSTDMYGVFMQCTNLENIIGLENFDTSQVNTMQCMFQVCKKLEELNVSNFDMSSVTNMQAIFMSCNNLKNINFGDNFNTNKVKNMRSVFSNCPGLEKLDLSKWNTSSATNMSSMFSGCNKLEQLDLNNFDTSNVTTMSSMFRGCSKLTTINMKNAIFDRVTSYIGTFNGNSVLSNITVKDAAAKTFIEARLADASKTGVTVTVA